MTAETGYKSSDNMNDKEGDYNSLVFVIASLINKIHTCTLVKIVSVTNTGTDSAVGKVNVQPLVNQTDGYGNPIPYAVLYNLPYFRLQGGANAIILDPQVGDIGIALFAEKDLTKVVATKAQANPDTARRFSMSDGLYIGGVLNGVPTQIVQFNTTGITITSPNLIQLNANDIKLVAPTIEMNASSSVTITTPTFTVNGATQLNGNQVVTGTIVGDSTIAASGDVTGSGGGHSLANHHHQVVNVQTGTSTINTGTTVS